MLQAYQRHPIKPLRRFCLRKVDRWIADRQESDGGWGGIQPPWVYSLIALHLLGYPDDHPAMVSGLAGMESFTIDEGDGLRRVEACQSPVWDTCLALVALHDAGVPDDDEAVQRGARVARSTSRSSAAATGRCGAPGSSPAAGRSSSRTPTTPTSTTPPRS